MKNNERLKKQWLSLYWLSTFLWASLIFYLSHLPVEELPGWQIPYLDKVVHLFLFGVLAFFCFRSVAGRFSLTFFLCLLYALSDEFHQSFIPGRFPDIYDLLADTSGIFLALLFVKQIDKS